MWRTAFAALLVTLISPLPAFAAAPAFTGKPAAVRKGGKVTISFAVSGPTDVAVEIVAGDGKVVRHLGGAALGAKNPPPPPFKPGLSQAIEWDGKDDRGKPVAGPGFKVRVRLGMKAGFDRFIGWKNTPPMNYSLINGLAVARDRKVYVMSISRDLPRSGRAENRLWVMSPEGKYLKTIYPYPASMDPAKLRGADFLSKEKNRLQPRIYDRVVISSLPRMRGITRQSMAMTSDGRLVFTNGWGTELYGFGPRAMMMMKTDGSIPRERIEGPIIKQGKWAGFLHLALAPDEKSAYVCGLLSNSRYSYPKKARNVVYRMGLGVEDKPEVIFGKPGQALSGKAGLTLPRGIAVDGKGRVYVSDFGNDRIVVLDPTGKYLGEIPLKSPGVISVHPKTGAIYAITMPGSKRQQKLVKFSGFEKPKVVAELDLTAKYGGVRKTHTANHPVMALDTYGDKPIVYLGSPAIYSRYRLLRVVDEGNTLKDEEVSLKSKNKSEVQGFPYPQGTNANGDLFFRGLVGSVSYDKFVRAYKYSGASGKIESTGLKINCTAGKDGLFYSGAGKGKGSYSRGSVARSDANGKLVPFSATGGKSEYFNDGRFSFNRSNLHILGNGNIWSLNSVLKSPFRISLIGPDGKVKRPNVVKGLAGPSSLRVDSRGNIYVADGLNLDGQPYPPEIDAFAKRLRAKGTTKRGGYSEAVEDCYGEAYGSILKFSAAGGEIRKLGKGEGKNATEKLLSAYGWRSKFAVKGLKGTYPRISPMSPPRGLEFSSCWCLFAVFDIDGHDRLFVPDAMQFCVRVLDANFNEILKFGGYDSATSRGGKANLPGPEIPFEFPTYVHVGGDAAYVTDTAPCARRVVRVKLSYAVEKTCAIR